MGLFDFLSREIAIDLGTANTLIIHKDKIVVDEPSIIAIDKNSNKVLAIGREAMLMHEKAGENIKTIKPLKDGVIADFHAAEQMIRGMIRMIEHKRRLFPATYRMVISIPSGITEVEKRAVRDSAEHAGATEMYMIKEPIAAALGVGIDIKKPVGSMIVDIGGGTTEIAVIALSGIVCEQSIRIASETLSKDIIDYMRRQRNLLIGERSAEQAKIEVGSALDELDDPPADYELKGRDLMTGIPKVVKISYSEIAVAIDKTVAKIEELVFKALEMTMPELSSDIYDNGIHLVGGGALLRGLDKRIALKTKIPIHVTDDPMRAVVRGAGMVLKNPKEYKAILIP